MAAVERNKLYCSECRQHIPVGARICPTCGSYQDWRRFLSIGQTPLALLVALFSVATTLATIIPPLLTSSGSDLKLLFESNTNASDVSFVVRNFGRSGGVVRLRELKVSFGPDLDQSNDKGTLEPFYAKMNHEGTFVEAGREMQISAKIGDQEYTQGSAKDICDHMQTIGFNESPDESWGLHRNAYFYNHTNRMACVFVYRETSFHSDEQHPNDHELGLNCERLDYVSQCFNRSPRFE